MTLPFMINKPELPERLEFVWDAFWALTGDRAMGFGSIGRITFLSIDRYAARFGVEGREEFERFMTVIRAMDRAFVSRMAEK